MSHLVPFKIKGNITLKNWSSSLKLNIKHTPRPQLFTSKYRPHRKTMHVHQMTCTKIDVMNSNTVHKSTQLYMT